MIYEGNYHIFMSAMTKLKQWDKYNSHSCISLEGRIPPWPLLNFTIPYWP
jgi:hypothetical protein